MPFRIIQQKNPKSQMNPALNIFQSDWKITHRMPVEMEEHGSPVVTWRENRDCPTVEASRGSICSEKFLSQITSTLFASWLVKGTIWIPIPALQVLALSPQTGC